MCDTMWSVSVKLNLHVLSWEPDWNVCSPLKTMLNDELCETRHKGYNSPKSQANDCSYSKVSAHQNHIDLLDDDFLPFFVRSQKNFNKFLTHSSGCK